MYKAETDYILISIQFLSNAKSTQILHVAHWEIKRKDWTKQKGNI